MNTKIEACDVQGQIVMTNYGEIVSDKDMGKIDFKEFTVIFYPAEPKIMQDAKIKGMVLELQSKFNQIL